MGWWGPQSIQNRHFCAQKAGLLGISDWSAPRLPLWTPKNGTACNLGVFATRRPVFSGQKTGQNATLGSWGRQSIQNRHFCAQRTGLVGIWDSSPPRVPFFDPKKRDNVQFTCFRHSASRFLRPKNGTRCHFGVVGTPRPVSCGQKTGPIATYEWWAPIVPFFGPKQRDNVQFRCLRHPASRFLSSKNGTKCNLRVISTPRPVF